MRAWIAGAFVAGSVSAPAGGTDIFAILEALAALVAVLGFAGAWYRSRRLYGAQRKEIEEKAINVSVDRSLKALDAALERYTHDLDAAKAAIEKLERQLEEARDRILRLEESLQHANDERDRVQRRLDQTLAERGRLETELSQLQTKVAELQVRVGGRRTEDSASKRHRGAPPPEG